MSIVITSDIHLSDNPRDAYRFEFITWLKRIIKKRKISSLLILGDITEEKDRHSAWLLNRIVDEVHALSKLCRIYILRGNHDGTDPTTPYFRFLQHLKNVTWINSITEIEITDIGNCLFLPHTNDYEKDWSKCKFEKFDWIFAHNTFEGASANANFRLSGVPVTCFPRGSKIISGDIHIPQKLGPVTYVGAPCLVDFGDDYQPRVLILDGADKKSLKYHGPQKRLVTILSVSELDGAARIKAKAQPGDILKVRVYVGNDLSKFPENKLKIREWGEKQGYIVHIVEPVFDKDSSMKKSKVSTEHSKINDKKLVMQYAKARNINERVLKTGLRLMKSV